MTPQSPAPQRPDPKPTPRPPNQKNSLPTPQGGSDSPGQNGDASRRQTRGVTALATRQQRRAVDFVSGGMMGNDGGDPTDTVDMPAATETPQKRKGRSDRSKSKGKKKAGAPSQENDTRNENVHLPASPSPTSTTNKTHQPPTERPQREPVKAVQRVETQGRPNNDADELLDQAPYRFERNEPQPGNAPPQKSQPSPSTSQSVQPALQQFLPQLISQVFPNLQTPDPNNIYDQLKYFEGATAQLFQSLAQNKAGPPQQEQASNPQPPTSRPPDKPTKQIKKTAKSAGPSSIRSHRHSKPQASVELSSIPKPNIKSLRPLDLAMGLRGRWKDYIRIRGRVRKIMLNAGIDWSRRWPDVPSREKSMLYEMVRHQIPYMCRFDQDWATAEIARAYSSHLRSEARKNDELPPDSRYNYLKANSAKRSPDAPRGTRPGLSERRGQANASNNEEQDPGSSGAGPSSQPDVNTTNDEEMMDAPGLFGSRPPSDDEDGSDLDDDPDFGGRE